MGRRTDRAPTAIAAQIAQAKHALGTLADQLATARADAGLASVSGARSRQALRQQGRQLAAARVEILAAIHTAQSAAADARQADDPAAARSYEQAAAALGRQLDVIEAADAQLDELSRNSAEQLRRRDDAVRRALGTLERALRDQAGLLTRLERLERQHEIATARSRPPAPGPDGEPTVRG